MKSSTFRAALVATSLMIVGTRASFGLDCNVGVAGKGMPAGVTCSVNRSQHFQSGTLGIPASILPAGRGIDTGSTISRKPNLSVSYSALGNVIQMTAGKSFGTQTTVPGRNDPPPSLAGRRSREAIGGTGF